MKLDVYYYRFRLGGITMHDGGKHFFAIFPYGRHDCWMVYDGIPTEKPVLHSLRSYTYPKGASPSHALYFRVDSFESPKKKKKAKTSKRKAKQQPEPAVIEEAPSTQPPDESADEPAKPALKNKRKRQHMNTNDENSNVSNKRARKRKKAPKMNVNSSKPTDET